MRTTQTKTLLMTADSVGGVWTYSLQLCAALAPYGIEVTLLVMGGKPSPDQMREAERLPNVRLIASDLKLEWMPEPDADLKRADALLLELEAEIRPDVVHLNAYCHAAAGFDAPVAIVAHSCVATWWQACRGGALSPEWDGYERRLRDGVAAADAFVAPTRAFLGMFSALHGEPRNARVILNGRDPQRYRPGAKRPVALAAGRMWDEAKNVAVLAQAAGRMTYPLFVAGEGALAEEQANVTFLGRLDATALAGRMAEAAVFAAPARYEPFGLAVLEAALSGCALVLGDIPTLRELWDEAALFVDPDDVAGIAAALESLLADPELAREMGEAARRRALRYSAEAMAAGYVALYGELLAARAGAVQPQAVGGRA
jgi:glycogen(starch) synthase